MSRELEYRQDGRQVIREFSGYRISWKRRGREIGGGELFELEIQGRGEPKTRKLIQDIELELGEVGKWMKPAENRFTSVRNVWGRIKDNSGLRIVVSFITPLEDGDRTWELMQDGLRRLVLS